MSSKDENTLMRRYPTPEVLMSSAMEATGLKDFGPGDFREGLAVLMDSLEKDGDLSPAADPGVIETLTRRLSNRLEVEAWYKAHPEIEDLPVRGPIDINGLPRTGTTALANMLSLDPQFRPLRGWEQARPCPPPILETEATDPRRLAAGEAEEQVSPELKAMHLFDYEATVEDTELLGMAFKGQQFTLPVYTYQDWWRRSDMTAAYQYHRRVVKLLQSRRPPNLWLFKAPHHNFHLEAITSAYPEARFIVTHRDPAKAIPSWASMVNAIMPPPAGKRDMHQFGREVSDHLRVGAENSIAARARLGEARFLDVHHRQLAADPLGTARRIYDFLDLELTPSMRQSIIDWDKVNRTGAHGAHRYTAEQFGLSKAQIRADYDAYIKHFDVEVED